MTISQRTMSVTLDDGNELAGHLAVPDTGEGPGILLLHDEHGVTDHARHLANLLAEEGWVTLLPDLHGRADPLRAFAYDAVGAAAAAAFADRLDDERLRGDAAAALSALLAQPECTGSAGVVGHGRGGALACSLARTDSRCAAVVAYDAPGTETQLDDGTALVCPCMLHVAGEDRSRDAASLERLRAAAANRADLSVHVYEGASPGFDNGNADAYDRPSHLMAKSRTLALLREQLGPKFDLAAIWEHHLYTEFADRDVDDSMETMVDEPYVFVVPTVTGGTGKGDLHRWYSNHFHFQNPEDAKLVPVSRTIGADRLVDEFVFCFTHDRGMDWILPGVEPTGAYIEIPMIAVVNFRGTRLYHEHIWWDQASVLVQAGLIDPAGLPVTGAEQAAAIQDETLPRNRLIPGWN